MIDICTHYISISIEYNPISAGRQYAVWQYLHQCSSIRRGKKQLVTINGTVDNKVTYFIDKKNVYFITFIFKVQEVTSNTLSYNVKVVVYHFKLYLVRFDKTIFILILYFGRIVVSMFRLSSPINVLSI